MIGIVSDICQFFDALADSSDKLSISKTLICFIDRGLLTSTSELLVNCTTALRHTHHSMLSPGMERKRYGILREIFTETLDKVSAL